MKIKPYMEELPFPDNMENTKELGFLDKNGNTLELYIGSGGGEWYEDEGILEWWVVSNWWDDKPLQPHQESEVKRFLNDYLRHHGVPKYEIIWRNYLEGGEDEQESHCFITLNPLPADEEKLWKSLWEGNKTKCKHEDLSIKTMEVLNGELLLTLDCDKCGKRTSTSASLNQGWEAEDLNTWAKQELSSHGQNVSFKNWAKKEVKSHGNIDLVDWAEHEKQSHTKKYGAEYENIGTMSVAPARGYNGYMNMMSSARRMVEIGNETGLDQKLGVAYQDKSGRWFLPILARKASESFSLDSKKADSINMEEPMVEEPSFIPDGDGRAIGQQNSSINLSPLHAETFEANAKTGNKVYIITRRSEDYSAYRELDVAGFGSKTEARKKFNLLFKESKEQDYPDETVWEAKDYMSWGEYWGVMSYNNNGIIYELREVIVGDKGDFYFDAESGLVDINYDAKIRLNNPKDAKYITPSIEEGMAFENGEGVLSSKSKIDMNAESRFDKLSNEIADEYEEKGMSPEKAQEVGDATAAMIGRKKYGKKGMAQMSKKGMNAEGDSATYSPSDEPDMVNEIQTSPTNESPQLFNASNTFNTTTALGIGGLVVAALSLPMLYSSAKSRLGKSAEEKRKSSGSVRKNHTQVKNSEYSVGQVNPVEAEGQQDIHGAEGITNPRHSPSPTPSGYPSKNLKMW